jgi:hypothetical protein
MARSGSPSALFSSPAPASSPPTKMRKNSSTPWASTSFRGSLSRSCSCACPSLSHSFDPYPSLCCRFRFRFPCCPRAPFFTFFIYPRCPFASRMT